jgi:hypothetical protein
MKKTIEATLMHNVNTGNIVVTIAGTSVSVTAQTNPALHSLLLEQLFPNLKKI